MTATFEEGRELLDTHKPDWSAVIREAIHAALTSAGTFHADDLLDLGIPSEHKNCVGAQVGGAVSRGWMVESGRRKSLAPESHGRKSSVYRSLLGSSVSSNSQQTAGARSGQPEEGQAPISNEMVCGDRECLPLQLFDVPERKWEGAA